MTSAPFILASSSPRRLALLADIGIIPTKIIAADIDETPQPRELPRQLAERLSFEKLNTVAAKETNAYIVAADTVVGVGRRILPKGENEGDVRHCLRLLSGRRHHVYTGVALRAPDGKIFRRLCDSTVIFRQLTEEDIEAYVKNGEGIGKAGAYGLQGYAASFVRYMSGSYSNIIGLPLYDVAQMLTSAGWK